MPAYAVFRVDNLTSGYYEAKKPNGVMLYPHFVNGPVDVASNAYGESEIGFTGLVLTNGVFGDQIGPVYASWEMMTYGSGFTVINDPASSIGAFMRSFNTVSNYCKIDSDLAAATSGNYDGAAPTVTTSIWARNSSGALVDTGENRTARNRMGISYLAGTLGLITPVSGDLMFTGDCSPL